MSKTVKPALLRLILASLGLALLMVAGISFWSGYEAVNEEEITTQLETSATASTQEEPDERIPQPINYHVASNHPRRILLPSIKTEGYVQQVDTNEENQIGVPSNIHVAGWFKQQKSPGEAGLSIIDGHYGGRYRPGIFHKLDQLEPGDEIEIEMGDYTKRKFRVFKKQQVTIDQADSVLYEQERSHQLNLITCGGDYLDDQKTYRDRVIVFTELVESGA